MTGARTDVPGWEGSIGPGPGQYGHPHVYARDVQSGAGNCVCGAWLGHPRHVQAAPGVDMPAALLPAVLPAVLELAPEPPTPVTAAAVLREQLAAIEHERWAAWQRYMHDRCQATPDGDLVIPSASVQRWERQMVTAYADLSPAEQASDMEQVDRYWLLIQAVIAERDVALAEVAAFHARLAVDGFVAVTTEQWRDAQRTGSELAELRAEHERYHQDFRAYVDLVDAPAAAYPGAVARANAAEADLAVANAILGRLRAAHRSAPYRDASGFEDKYCLGCDAADGSWPCPVAAALDGGDHA